MEINIEKGIELHKPRGRKSVHSYLYDAFDKMEVGDSFLIESTDHTKWQAIAYTYWTKWKTREESRYKYEFTSRRETLGTRVWRTK